mmetsp:Transcript_23735/g.59402  ORF Transcript_23735/g.59402 Transcript_23735/m.59402 type:complete len:307 (+) Transcript_23735:325-1245(+)
MADVKGTAGSGPKKGASCVTKSDVDLFLERFLGSAGRERGGKHFKYSLLKDRSWADLILDGHGNVAGDITFKDFQELYVAEKRFLRESQTFKNWCKDHRLGWIREYWASLSKVDIATYLVAFGVGRTLSALDVSLAEISSEAISKHCHNLLTTNTIAGGLMLQLAKDSPSNIAWLANGMSVSVAKSIKEWSPLAEGLERQLSDQQTFDIEELKGEVEESTAVASGKDTQEIMLKGVFGQLRSCMAWASVAVVMSLCVDTPESTLGQYVMVGLSSLLCALVDRLQSKAYVSLMCKSGVNEEFEEHCS